ncbi:MAG TPA: SDR family NAD(P)-dependent oxidoreductase [Terracidiphilus sp.]|nr:SDR family NAD(P)-dependent oxidoreductase [Terracidiphilus sp.]
MRSVKVALVSGAALAGIGAVCAGATAALVVKGLIKTASQRLRGKVVLITGGSRGLGLALAEEFGRRGAKLVLTARDREELERARISLIRESAVESAEDIFVVSADLRKSEDADAAVERATDRFGRVDILVNNAGIITVGPVEDQTVRDFHDAMDSNFFSGVHCTFAVAPQMLRRNDGVIVNITSIGGKVAVPHLLPYTASKFAAVGFSEGLNAELRSKGIHVLTVCPGLMRTGSHVHAMFTGDAAKEYRWFSLAANLPGLSIAAHRAARRIVRAVVLKENEIAITPQAILASRLSNLAPGVTARVMGAVNRLLPSPVPGNAQLRSGADVRAVEPIPTSPFGRVMKRRHYNQSLG